MVSAPRVIDKYTVASAGVTFTVEVVEDPAEFVNIYRLSAFSISPATKIILDKIREEFIVNVEVQGTAELDVEKLGGISESIRKGFEREIGGILKKYFPSVDRKTYDTLLNYLIQQNIGFGDLEPMLKDAGLEEIVINGATEPVWVYHRKHGWLKTSVTVPRESKIRHYATVIGREVGKDITLLNPLMDASLKTGDRVNATLNPISTKGNTITIRKFAEKPWTIADFLNKNTLSVEVAAMIWLCVENELSVLISGGTGSGKTSALNVVMTFFPPNQRIISIEDTREVVLPSFMHWVPLETRLPNPEGKGAVTMLDLVVNSLRMRPDRIVVGEIRRKQEALVLFEAMQTGHSVYATIHANNADETVQRLTHEPIDVPKAVLPTLGVILVMNRNRRTGFRRALQLAEMTPGGDARVIYQLDAQKDVVKKIAEPDSLFKKIGLYTGLKPAEINANLKNKVEILRRLQKIEGADIQTIGYIFAHYYTNKDFKVADIQKLIDEAKR
ncbi:MAG: type II/IV secretion system ATPase subunit [Nanoarchaeota archaeon]